MAFWEPAVIGATIGAGASVLGMRSNERQANNANSASIDLSRENRQWQDSNYYRTMSDQLGNEDYQSPYGHQTSIGQGRGSDILGRDRDLDYSQRYMDQSFSYMEGKGMTPQEIAGSPVPGGAKMTGGNNVLGNAVNTASSDRSRANTAITSQLINSKTQLATAKISADAHLKGEAIRAGVGISAQQTTADTARYVSDLASKTGKFNTQQVTAATRDAAKIHANASKYSTDANTNNVLAKLKVTQKLNDAQISKMSAQIALIKQDTQFKAILHDERWQKLFSTMSADNVLASVLAARSGIDIKEVLKGNVSKENIALLNFSQAASASKSSVRNTWHGYSTIGIEYAERVYSAINQIIDSLKSD